MVVDQLQKTTERFIYRGLDPGQFALRPCFADSVPIPSHVLAVRAHAGIFDCVRCKYAHVDIRDAAATVLALRHTCSSHLIFHRISDDVKTNRGTNIHPPHFKYGVHRVLRMSTVTDTIQIENVVASSDIGQELALEQLATDLRGAEYNPDDFPGVVYRLDDPKSATLIFHSGKVVCTGTNSVDDVHAALEIVFEDLRELGIDVVSGPEIEVQNIVSSAGLGQSLNLNAIAIGLGLEQVEYEPEQFPGLVYRLDDPDVVVLLFGSGKLIITGGNDTDQAQQALLSVHDRLTELGLLD